MKTNKKLMQSIMANCQTGLTEAFIINAVSQQIEIWSKITDTEIENMSGTMNFINMYSWRDTAKNIKVQFDENYK